MKAVAAGFVVVISLSGQSINTGGIVNLANFQGGIAAHSLVAAFGTDLAPRTCQAPSAPLPRTLCGASLVISDAQGNSVQAPLFYVSPTQINFQMPVGFGVLRFCVGASCQMVNVALQAPAIFEYQRAPGVFDPIILHQDGSLVTPTNRARNGETLTLYATGMSIVFRNGTFPPDGEAAPASPLFDIFPNTTVRVSEEIVTVTYAGLAPGFVSLWQFNFKVDREFDPGFRFPPGEHPLRLEEIAAGKSVVLYVR